MTISDQQPPRRSAGAISHRRVQLAWPKGQEFRILSIDGGGIRGIFPAAFLSGLEYRFLDGKAITPYFDLIAGTSTGGIIALGLGSGLTASDLLDLYLHRGREVFPPLPIIARPAARFLNYFKYRYSRQALTNVLQDTFGETKFGDSRSRLCIPSCDGTNGEVYVFKTPHHQDYRQDYKEAMTKVGLATSAAPGYFKPLVDGGYTFVDGGVWCNNPIMVGLVDTLACFRVPPDHIRVLSLSCGINPYKVGRVKRKFGGKLFWYDIIFAAMRFQSENAIGQAGLLIGRDRIKRVCPHNTIRPIELDDWKRASNELPLAAEKRVDEFGDDVAALFLREPTDNYLPFTRKSPAF
ncbi:MAG: CBASS cGAMP-activated phospholipase [Caldilineaceae bacterium]|nr:CBASS cGAMP-activated phospholipase [Caldilineaceae bacterium]